LTYPRENTRYNYFTNSGEFLKRLEPDFIARKTAAALKAFEPRPSAAIRRKKTNYFFFAFFTVFFATFLTFFLAAMCYSP